LIMLEIVKMNFLIRPYAILPGPTINSFDNATKIR